MCGSDQFSEMRISLWVTTSSQFEVSPLSNLTKLGSMCIPSHYAALFAATGEHRWVHAKPLDAAIGRVLALYRHSGRHDHCRCRRVQNTNKTQLLASNYCTFLLAKLYIFVTRKGASTHVIDATSFVTMWDNTIQKEAISYISSYQTLTADKNSKSY